MYTNSIETRMIWYFFVLCFQSSLLSLSLSLSLSLLFEFHSSHSPSILVILICPFHFIFSFHSNKSVSTNVFFFSSSPPQNGSRFASFSYSSNSIGILFCEVIVRRQWCSLRITFLRKKDSRSAHEVNKFCFHLWSSFIKRTNFAICMTEKMCWNCCSIISWRAICMYKIAWQLEHWPFHFLRIYWKADEHEI